MLYEVITGNNKIQNNYQFYKTILKFQGKNHDFEKSLRVFTKYNDVNNVFEHGPLFSACNF